MNKNYTFPIVLIIANVILCSFCIFSVIKLKILAAYFYYGIMVSVCCYMIYLSIKEIVKIKQTQ